MSFVAVNEVEVLRWVEFCARRGAVRLLDVMQFVMDETELVI